MIDIEKFICSLLADHPVGVTVREDIHEALKDQGLEYKGGKIVPIEDKTALKESEDEKVRESIIELVKQSSEILDKKNQERMLAWLEKQAEQKRFIDHIQIGDKVTRNKNGVLVNLSQLARMAKQGEKGTNGNEREIPFSEQPTDKVEPKFKVGDIIKPKDNGHEPWQIMQVDILDKKYRFKDGYIIHFSQEDNYELVEPKPEIKYIYTNFRVGDVIVEIKPNGSCQPVRVKYIGDGAYLCESDDGTRSLSFPIIRQDEYKLIEPNPTWSVEDEAMWAEISDLLWKGYKQSGSKFSWDNIRDWIKPKIEYFKDRVQPKQEWSKEDDEMMQYVIDSIDTRISDLNLSNIRTWFKSLKQRYTWKPSDEEMKALSDINLTGCVSYAGQGQTLIELYNDLYTIWKEKEVFK